MLSKFFNSDSNWLFSRRSAGDGELWDCREHVVVVLPGPRQWDLLRDAHLPAEPRSLSPRESLVHRVHFAVASGGDACHRVLVIWDATALAPDSTGAAGHADRHGWLVFLLLDLRPEHAPE